MSNTMIGYTWMDEKGQLFSEAFAHIMLYALHLYTIYTADVNSTSTKPSGAMRCISFSAMELIG